MVEQEAVNFEVAGSSPAPGAKGIYFTENLASNYATEFCYNLDMNQTPQRMKNYASFSEWSKAQSEVNQDLIKRLKELIDRTAPQLTTTVKWGQGCWVDGATPRVFIHTEDDHVQLGFYNGSSLSDPRKLLSGNGKYVRFIKVYSPDDIEPEAYGRIIEQAVKSP